MDTDLLLTIGVVLIVFSIPSLLAAWVEARAPRIGAIMIVAGIGLLTAALINKPDGYPLNDILGVMLKVVSRLVN